ncbi:hypothetical protein ACQP04_29070 [Pseudonocardia halophobica]|uniref:hypothetical protein n=1 Tax=Pseudonocardia halophobica TaxID=29401 RepID=UPI003D8A37B3
MHATIADSSEEECEDEVSAAVAEHEARLADRLTVAVVKKLSMAQLRLSAALGASEYADRRVVEAIEHIDTAIRDLRRAVFCDPKDLPPASSA